MILHTYARLTGISMVYTFATYLVVPVLAPYFASLGYSEMAISLLFGLFPLIMVFGGVLMGALSHRVGRYWVLLVAFLLNIIAYWLYLFGAPLAIIAGRVLDAVCFSAVGVLLLAKLEDSLDDKTRGRFTGITLSLEYASKLAAPIIGGVLADKYIGAPFVVSIILFAILAFVLRSSAFHLKPVHAAVQPLAALRWFFATASLRPFAVLGPTMAATVAAFVVFLPLMITAEFGLPYVSVGAAFAVLSAAHLLQFFFGDLSDQYGRKPFIIAGCALYGSMMLIIAFVVSSYEGLLVALGIVGIGSAVWNIVAWSAMSDIATREQKEGLLVGSYVSVAKIGETFGFLLGGVLVAITGIRSVFFALGCVALLGTLAAAVMFLAELERGKGALPKAR